MMNTWFQGVRGGITVDFNYVGNFLMHANHVRIVTMSILLSFVVVIIFWASLLLYEPLKLFCGQKTFLTITQLEYYGIPVLEVILDLCA